MVLYKDGADTRRHDAGVPTPRRLSMMERDAVKSIIADWLDKGIIRSSRSEYASPILLRKKKNGLYRRCVDYRKLNEKITKDRYPLPLMEDVIDSLVQNEVLQLISKMDFFM